MISHTSSCNHKFNYNYNYKYRAFILKVICVFSFEQTYAPSKTKRFKTGFVFFNF